MTTRPVDCVAEETLHEVLALPESDPRRSHLESCPRCRALVLSYRQFVAPDAQESTSYGTEEATRLDDFRGRLMSGTAAGAGAAAPQGGGAPGGSWWSRLFAPALRPVWGLAALAIVLGGLWLGPRIGGPRGSEPVLRGGTQAALALGEVEHLADGSVRLMWQPHPEAEHYELRFYSASLEPIAGRPMGLETSVTVAPGDMPEAWRAGAVVLYRIVAMRGGDEIEASAPGSLQR